MALLREFKQFALRGNVIDIAVGIIIGAAFTTVVQSAVNDVIMPPIGLLTGGADFSDLFINLSATPVESLEAAKAAGVPVIAYGVFINAVLSLLIVAAVLFFIVRGMNRLRRKEATDPAPPPAPTRQEVLLEEIRDLLKPHP